MPLYSEDTATRSFLPLDEIPSTFADVMNAQFGQTLTELPLVAGKRLTELTLARGEGTQLPKSDALARVESAGLSGHLQVDDAGITDSALSILIERKQEELQQQQTLARARGGFGEGAARLGVALGTSLLDPVNVGLAFVPVVGEARYLRILGKAGGALGRAGVRAGVGAAEGAAGAAIIEPLIYTAKQQEQADYDMSDSLMNVAFGTIFGGGLHTVGGAGADLYRGWRGRGDVPEAFIPRDETLNAADSAVETRFRQQIANDVDGTIAAYEKLPDAEGGKVLAGDVARELSPDYIADRTKSAAVQEPSSWLVKEMYRRRLAAPLKEGEEPIVVFSAGGTGAGKTTGLKAIEKASPEVKAAQVVYDSNLSSFKSGVQKIDQALAAGKKARILYTFRDPAEAMTEGVLKRAMQQAEKFGTGRTVPATVHAKTHVDSRRVIGEIAKHYEENPNVSVSFIDNSRGKGKAAIVKLEDLPELEYNSVRERSIQRLEEARSAGSISEAIYRGVRGDATEVAAPAGERSIRSGSGGQPEPESSRGRITAADRAAEASPQVREAALRTAVGQAADGRAVNVEPLFAGNRQAIAETSARAASAPDPDAPRQIEAARAIDEEIAQSNTALEAAEEEAALAESLLAEHAKRFDYEATDPDIEAAAALTKQAERWSRMANAATACLIRGA